MPCDLPFIYLVRFIPYASTSVRIKINIKWRNKLRPSISQTTLKQHGQTRLLLLWPWPWPDNLDIWIWPRYSEDIPAYQK